MRAALAALLLAGCSQAQPVENRPTVDVLTGLPLFWGEGDVADILQGTTTRSLLVDALDKHYELRPMDIARRAQLSKVDRLLIIQPQALAPDELVEIDRWIHKGGRALFLADPALNWPSTLPKDDPRRAPVASMLDPLFLHWGLKLVPWVGLSPVAEPLEGVSVVFDAPGAWEVTGSTCVADTLRVARCQIGKGEAVLVSDADFVHPRWAQTTSGRNYAALEALMARLWPEAPTDEAEQRKDEPPD